MIGFSLQYGERKLEKAFQVQMRVPLLYQPYYYLSSEIYPDLFCIPSESPTEIFPMELGLIPEHVEDISEYRFNNNTKSIQIAQLTSKHKRCLILATGLIIPRYHYSLKKQVPFYYHLKNEEVFCLAGIYDEIKPDYYSTSYVISDNFPLVIKEGYEFEYLKGSLGGKKSIFGVKDFKAYQLTPDIYHKDGDFNKIKFLSQV